MTDSIIAITGSSGFLGRHTCSILSESILRPIKLGKDFDKKHALASLENADSLIHLAGVNRGENVGEYNIWFAEQLSESLQIAKNPPKVIAYANSIQAGNGTEYGQAKQEAARILSKTAGLIGAEFVDIKLPNLFGEGGKPFYNMVTSTFCALLANNEEPKILEDKKLALLYVKDAANLITGKVPVSQLKHLEEEETVSGLLARLRAISESIKNGKNPNCSSAFQKNLVVTYSSFI
jgi:UDP-2-acetamido-2,6-beta-L-arabino-hexul-4-ose reductase